VGVYTHKSAWLLSLALVVAVVQGNPVAAQTEAIRTLSPDDVHRLINENKGKMVIVNFWASWCPPCLEEFPDIIEVYDDYHTEGLEVIAVSMNAEDETADIEEFLGNYDPPFTIYRAASQDAAFFEGVVDDWFGEMPTTLIFDAEGNRTHFYKRQITYEELVQDVTSLLPVPVP